MRAQKHVESFAHIDSFNRWRYAKSLFFLHFLATPKIFHTFAHKFQTKRKLRTIETYTLPMQYALYNGILAAQENCNFLVKKWSDYLVVPNNLLLSLIGAPSLIPTPNAFSYAREARRVPPINKGLSRDLFVQLFMPFCHFGKSKIRPNLFIKL